MLLRVSIFCNKAKLIYKYLIKAAGKEECEKFPGREGWQMELIAQNSLGSIIANLRYVKCY